MADKSLRYVLSATDKNAGKTIGDVAGKGTKAAASIGSAFGKLGQVIGGEVGEITNKVQEAFAGIEEHAGSGLSKKFEMAGAGILGVGSALTVMGDKDRQAQQQLDNAIENTGHHASDFRDEIEKTVGSMEKYGYTASTTQNALQTLTNATHDPKHAIELMGEAADLAASKHISLNSAATQLARVIGGKGARTLAQYNIELVKNSDGTTNWAATNDKLAKVLHGQANASVSGFTGKLKELRAEISDQISEIGMKYGPAITAAGAAMTVLAPIVRGLGNGFGALKAKIRGAGEAATTTADETAAADTRIVESNTAAAESGSAVGGGARGAAGALVKFGVGATIAVGAGFALAEAIDGVNNELTKEQTALKDTTSALTSLQTRMVNSKGPLDQVGQSWVRQTVTSSGLADAAAKVGLTIDDVSNAITGNDSQMRQLISTWPKHGTLTASEYAELIRLSNGYRSSTKAAEANRAATDKQSSALNGLAGSLGATNAELATYIAGMRAAGHVATVTGSKMNDPRLGGSSQGHAGGSDFFSGGSTLIAEREPEIVDLPRGSSITPLSKIRRGGGGTTVQLNVQLPPSGLYSPEAARFLVTQLEQWLRSGGGIKGLTY